MQKKITWGSHCSVHSDKASSLHICAAAISYPSVVGAGLLQNNVGKPIELHIHWWRQ